MNLKKLERMRKKEMFKFLILLTLNTLIVLAIGFITKNPKVQAVLGKKADGLFAAPFVFAYIYILMIPKMFENKAKKYLLPHVLKDIFKDDGKIEWYKKDLPFSVSVEDEELEENKKFIKKLKKLIEKRCKNNNYLPDNILDINKLAAEQNTLEQKETLTEEDKKRLSEIKTKMDHFDRIVMDILGKEYIVRAELIKKIEKKCLSKTPKEEDLIKLEYLKKENQRYEIENELYLLEQKNENELTDDEKARIDFLKSELRANINKEEKPKNTYPRKHWMNISPTILFNKKDVDLFDIDDNFYGEYKGIEFVAIEHKTQDFKGTIIKIKLKNDFKGNLLILSKKFNNMSKNSQQALQQGLNLIEQNDFKGYTIWAKNQEDVNNIFDYDFIKYIKTSNKRFSYLFKCRNAYLMWPHSRDFYKFATLFRNIESKGQYQRFTKDVRNLLNEIERFAKAVNKGQ